jgi:hypothetical protein
MSHFNRCVTIQRHRDGLTHINCKLGLWGVTGPSFEQAMDEATYYFSQYKLDGEYSSIIGGKSAAEILISNAGSK